MIFFFQAEDGIRDLIVTGVQTCALPIFPGAGDWPIFVRNRSEQFEARFVMVEIMPSASLFFQGMQGSRMPIATAHGEGRALFGKNQDRALVCMRYVNNRGEPTESYPYNPSGSPHGI